MNAVPWTPGDAGRAATPPDVAAARLAAPADAPVAGLLEAILRSTAPRRITLLSAGGARLVLFAAEGALRSVEGAAGPPAESGKARIARLAALLGGFCAAAAAGGTIRARIEAAGEDEASGLAVPPEALAALVPALPAEDGAAEAADAADDPARDGPQGHDAHGHGAPTGAAIPSGSAVPASAPCSAPGPDSAVEGAPGAPAGTPAPDPAADPAGDALGEALGRALAEVQVLAAALPGAGIAWIATRPEAAAGGGRLVVRPGGDAPPAVLPATGAAEAGAILDGWIAQTLGAPGA